MIDISSVSNKEYPLTDIGKSLNILLANQIEVEKAWGRLPDICDDDAVSSYIREVILCIEDELHEVLAEVHWKPWKISRGIKNIAAYREEMADVLHFILDLYLVAGLDGYDIAEDYLAKHDKNMDRVSSDSYRMS